MSQVVFGRGTGFVGVAVLVAAMACTAQAAAQSSGPAPYAPAPYAPSAQPMVPGSQPVGPAMQPGYYPPGAQPMLPGMQPAYYPPQNPMLGARELTWEPGEPVPPGYHATTKMSRGLLIGGAVTFGTVWLIGGLLPGSLGTATDSASGLTPLLIPCAGPFIAMGTLRSSGIGTFWLGVDGVAQTAGAVMLIAALVSPKNILRRDDLVAKNWLIPLPMSFGPASAGAGLAGSF